MTSKLAEKSPMPQKIHRVMAVCGKLFSIFADKLRRRTDIRRERYAYTE